MLAGRRRVAMQYSPHCAIPYVAMVDAGTVELVRSLGAEVVSSAELIQAFEARWTPEALASHQEAGKLVDAVRAAAFDLVRERTRNGLAIQEFEVKQFILDSFRQQGLFTDHGPIVGVNANASNPHYEPTEQVSSAIRAGDFVLIDLWAKLDRPGAVYYDITWTGFCGDSPAETMRNVFAVVAGARDAAVARELTKRFEEVRRGPLSELAAYYAETGAPRGEIVIVIGPPAPRAALGDSEIDAMLENALARESLKDAVAEVVSMTGLPRKQIYARALALSDGA
jgi:hypothetical protein